MSGHPNLAKTDQKRIRLLLSSFDSGGGGKPNEGGRHIMQSARIQEKEGLTHYLGVGGGKASLVNIGEHNPEDRCVFNEGVYSKIRRGICYVEIHPQPIKEREV